MPSLLGDKHTTEEGGVYLGKYVHGNCFTCLWKVSFVLYEYCLGLTAGRRVSDSDSPYSIYLQAFGKT